MGQFWSAVDKRISSHYVHGTWSSLLLHYLVQNENENGTFKPRDHNRETVVDQYVYIPTLVLQAMKSYIQFIFVNSEDKKDFTNLLDSINTEIMKINTEAIGSDLKIHKDQS